MRKRSLDHLRQQLESLFSGPIDATPRTGPLQSVGADDIPAPSGWVWECDREGRYTWCSPEIEQLAGFAPQDLVGQSVYGFALTEDSAETLRAQMQAQQVIQGLQATLLTRDGRQLKVLIHALQRKDDRDQVLGYRGVFQVLAGQEMPARRFAAPLPFKADELTATTPAPLVPTWGPASGYEYDGRELRPLEEQAGASVEQSQLSDDRLLVPIRSQDDVLGVLEFEAPEGEEPWTAEDLQFVEAIAQQLALALQDARAYQLTQQALEEMREADRLKSQFLANMSHELRTPLNSIIGFSRVILKGIDGPINETQEEDLQAIYSAGQHLLGLINDILDLSKIEAGKMELAFAEVDLKEIIQGVLSTAIGLVKDKPIKLSADVPEDLPTVQADNIRVRQVLLNLVSNAAKFTEQGRIAISARRINDDGREAVMIAVSDTGPGIEVEDQARLFEPFSQVDASPTRKTGGTGLGLSISRHLVELHGGRIWVESKPGAGSTFAFTLPLAPLEAEDSAAGRPLVLVVEDDPRAVAGYRQHLADRGYRLHSVRAPQETVELANELRPAAILLDPTLPGHLGWEVLARLKADPEARSVPILVGSYFPEQERGFTLGADAYLTMPIDEQDMLATLRRLGVAEGETRRVLVVADQADEMRRLCSAIEAAGPFQTEVCHDGESARARLAEQPPDLVLLDLLMGGGKGFDTLENLRARAATARVPVVALIPASPQAWQKELLDHGCRFMLEHCAVPASELMEAVGRQLHALSQGS